MVVNGKVEDMGYTSASTMTIATKRCSFSCTSANTVNVDATPRYWSKVNFAAGETDWCTDPAD